MRTRTVRTVDLLVPELFAHEHLSASILGVSTGRVNRDTAGLVDDDELASRVFVNNLNGMAGYWL